MEARAEFRFIRITDRKVRIILNLIKGKKIDIAFNILKFTNKRGADIVRKLLRSAVSNISAKQGVDVENLFVAKAYANQGPSGKPFQRLHARAMGRGAIIKKKLSHATIIVSDTVSEVGKVKKVKEVNKVKEVKKVEEGKEKKKEPLEQDQGKQKKNKEAS